MKGVMRKRLLSLLSVVGLASSSTPASTQVLKGSQPADTKSESTVKSSKKVQEDAASKDAAKMTKVENERKAGGIQQEAKHKIVKTEHENAATEVQIKGKLSSAEGGHATSDVITEKQRKAGAEQKATSAEHKHKQTAAEKVAVSNELTHKDKTKVQMGDGSVIKGEKAAGESNAAKQENLVKGRKAAAGANAAQSEASKKVNQASPK